MGATLAFKEEFPPLLEFGFHLMSEGDLRLLTVEMFPLSATRPVLWESLEWLTAELRRRDIWGTLWIDGSFLTEKIDPDDIDFVLMVEADVLNALNYEQLEFVDSLAEQEFYGEPLKLHSFIAFTAPNGHPMAKQASVLHARWVRDFGYSYHKKTPKGIVLLEVRP